jgi:putative transposase
VKPRLVARGPNQAWSWDITKLRGPVKRRLFYLFVLIDIYSRYVVGWTLSRRSSSVIAADLVRRTVERQSIAPGQVVVHGDRGTELVSKEVVHHRLPGPVRQLRGRLRFVEPLLRWYNAEHRHSGIAYLTPEVVHHGWVEAVQEVRQAALEDAWKASPERFVKGPPRVPQLPHEVWINRPRSEETPERMLPKSVEQVSQSR